MPEYLTAIEIDAPKTWELMCALDPSFQELDYDFNKGSFLVLNHEGHRWMIVTPLTIAEHFSHIEPSSFSIKTVNLVPLGKA